MIFEYLTQHAVSILNDRYIRKGDTHPKDIFWRAATAFSDSQEMAEIMYGFMGKGWFQPSTPILANAPVRTGYAKTKTPWHVNFNPEFFEEIKVYMPISCYQNSVEDTIPSLIEHTEETRYMSVSGGGVGGYWGNIRSVSNKSPGPIPFIKTLDADVIAYKQGSTRRAAYAAYLNINHPDIVEFINLRDVKGGDINRKTPNLHLGVCYGDDFVKALEEDKGWDLIDPHTKRITETVSARGLLQAIYIQRHKKGEPFLVHIDEVNRHLPDIQKKAGLKVTHSNLCTEIMLPTNKDRSAVCCVSSINLSKWYEYHSELGKFIYWVSRYLDNVLEYFIHHAPESLSKARYATSRERAVGIGTLGFHSLLQKHSIPFDSASAKSWNLSIFRGLHAATVKASLDLVEQRGEPEDMKGTGLRNSHRTAIAPNATSSIIAGTSPGIEPWKANVFKYKTTSGVQYVRNPELESLINFKLVSDEKTKKKYWDIILEDGGRVDRVDCLTPEEKEVFKVFVDIDQNVVIDLALDRQPYIDQGQSVNLAFPSECNLEYFHAVHWRAMKNGLKSLYYARSGDVMKADVGGTKVSPNIDFVTDPNACLACEN